ncbi:MAG: aminoacyl-tRNA hydrolase [Sedimentisphaerales bacterium]|nr:aminoacyl-tRNA hydrolase [Sedimentisphaerales bacterium]
MCRWRQKETGSAGSMTETKLIVGLGNPGAEYVGTRHNAGFETIDRLAERLGVDVKKKKFGGLFGETIYEDRKLLLLKPQQYMNCSGQIVATAMGFFKLSMDALLVITDDMALPPGRIRLRAQGSAGGHNGLADIIGCLNRDFARLRIGIGTAGTSVTRDYVLSRPGSDDREQIDDAISRAVLAVLCWAAEGMDRAMNLFNVKSTDNETEVNNQ